MSDDTLLQTRLAALTRDGALVEIDRDNLDSETLVGRVLHQTPYVVVLEKVDDAYRFDGVAAVRPSDITRLRSGGRELAAGGAAQPSAQTKPFQQSSLVELTAMMTELEQRYGYVTLHAERPGRRTSFVGQVLELDDDYILMKTYAPLSRMDRKELLIRSDEITRVEAGGAYEATLIKAYSQE